MMTTTTMRLQDSTIGKKMVMAASGTVLVGFAFVHLVGLLQIFRGPDVVNGYHVFLYGVPSLLWTVRALVLGALVAHVASATALARRNRLARPSGYARVRYLTTDYAARTMLLGGVLLGAYLVHHVAHMTAGLTAGLGYRHDHVDVYANMVQSYQVPWMAGLTVALTVVFGLHVYHGIWSMLQSLGVNHPRYNAALRRAAGAGAIALTLGYLSVPLAVVTGLIR